MSHSLPKRRWNGLGLLAAGAAAMVLWAVFRHGPDVASENPGPGAAARESAATSGAPAEPDAKLLRESFRRPSGESPPPVDPSDVAQAVEVPAGQVEALRQERVVLYGQLSDDADPVLGKVKALLAGTGVTADEAASASAWRLAQQWRILALAEADTAARSAEIEDPQLRDELTRVRRTILVGAAVKEWEAIQGAPVEGAVLAQLEALGRRLAAEGPPDTRTRSRLGAPEIGRRSRPRRVDPNPE